MNHVIYTIGRQFGSGGREIGKAIAEKEKIPFYDREMLNEAAKGSGISERYFEEYDEKLKKHFFQSVGIGNYSESMMPMAHKVILAQFAAIKRLAAQGPCVFIGRCADYVLRERPNIISVFVYGNLESREQRAAEKYGVQSQDLRSFIMKTDQARAEYYNYYTDNKWGKVETYDLMLNSSRLESKEAADVIICYAKKTRGGIRK